MSKDNKNCCTHDTKENQCCGEEHHQHNADGCCTHHEHDHHHGEGCGCHSDNEPLESITLTTDDGDKILCNVIGVFEVDDKEYIALLPENSEDVFIYGYSEDGDDVQLDKIESDEEYQRVGDAFMKLWSEEEE